MINVFDSANKNDLMNILDQVNVGIIFVDKNRTILYANNKMSNILGYGKGEIIGMNCENFSVPEDDVRSYEMIKEAISNKMLQVVVNKRYIHKSGKIISCELSINLSQITDFFIIFVKDISEKLKREKQHNILAENLKNEIGQKDKMFSIISHDLKGPLGTLYELVKLLIDEYPNFDDKKKLKILKSISKTTIKSRNLLADLLLWARMQNGNLKLIFVEVDLNEFIEQNMSLVNQMALNKQIKINYSSSDVKNFYADKFSSSTILRNLLTNAIKFTERNGNINIYTKKQIVNKIEYVEFCIKDNGIGISQNKLNNLFLIDDYTTSFGTENETGTGLGLSLCKKFVEKNGGTIRVESKEGVGSLFYFTLLAHNQTNANRIGG